MDNPALCSVCGETFDNFGSNVTLTPFKCQQCYTDSVHQWLEAHRLEHEASMRRHDDA